MQNVEKLEKMLNEEFMPELDESINEAMNLVDDKPSNKNFQNELEDLEDIKVYFDDVLLDIKNKSLLEEDALDILKILEEMAAENE